MPSDTPSLWRGLVGSTLMVVGAGAALVVWLPGSIADGPEPTVSHGVPRPWADRSAAAPVETVVESMSAAPAQARSRRAAGGGAAQTALPRRSGAGRRVVYSISRQRVWLVRADGKVERHYLVSGHRGQPGAGAYRIYSKSRHARSAIHPGRMEYMVRFTYGRRTGTAIGFHSIPVDLTTGKPMQQVAQLGQPLSAGCVRLRLQGRRHPLTDLAHGNPGGCPLIAGHPLTGREASATMSTDFALARGAGCCSSMTGSATNRHRCQISGGHGEHALARVAAGRIGPSLP